jgi:hypothetical protein
MPSRDDSLAGTTRRVYRHIYKRGPLHTREIQRNLGLSSSSVAEYHVQKLTRLGLIRESKDGFVADKIVLDNMIRIKRTVFPTWALLAVFFAISFVLLLTLERPSGPITHSYLFSLIVVAVALTVSASQTVSSITGGA